MFPYRRVLILSAWFGASLPAATVPTCSGAELFSKESVRYGRWEFRMLAAAKLGTVSSFFTYYNDSYLGGVEPWREIDIEVLGNKPKGFQSNLITRDPSTPDKTESPKFHTTTDVSSAFHTFSLSWTPDSVVWRMDGKLLRRTMDDPQVTDLGDKDQSYRINLWASDQVGWVGAFDLTQIPVYQVVNWMVYSSYTPGEGPGGSNFSEQWVDDFSSFDTKRWSTGNYGFETNLALFTPKNVVAVDGYLVLALTRPGQEGVTGTFLKDSLGNSRNPTGLAKAVSQGSQWSVRSNRKGLRIDREDATNPLKIRVMNALGLVVAQGRFERGQKMTEMAVNQKEGVLIVSVGDRVVTLVR